MFTVTFDAPPRLGGHLCLDFVNTVDPRYGSRRIEYLTDYHALVDWAVWIGTLAIQDGHRLTRTASDNPTASDEVLDRAHQLRGVLHTLFAPNTRGQSPGEAIALFNEELRIAMQGAALVQTDDRYQAGWISGNHLDRALWPIVQAATELLLSPSLHRVRECDGHECGWLFLDSSKAGRRRWCSMAICGNRAKADRHRRLTQTRSR